MLLENSKMAFCEVYNIIQNSEDEIKNKIPKNFIDLIYSNMDKEYKPNIDYTKNIEQQQLMHKTLVIMSLIYRDYLCTKEEREEILKKDKEILAQKEKELRVKYNPDNLFKSKKIDEKDKLEEKILPVQYKKQNIFIKIINKIKDIFKRG